ncbi:GNAT family N-acetyltransferase [Burkholderia vietnamiensis]|nr:GNAT family N-acetyltransferase [Burkholderia vietnamiensis]HDR9077505.1 GNAT family N-acetyltransferase [Burkholderia vietnamiensis]HDR9103913.1 GNAT family N-acetyltransferase [Burkholderia vietnamiensis]
MSLLRRHHGAAVSYSEPFGGDAVFVITAFGGMYGGELGRISFQPFKPTDSCFVTDLIVSPEYRRQGIAINLLKRALLHSGCTMLVPVDIVEDAIRFWSHLAIKGDLSVRLGLTQSEMWAIQYALRPVDRQENA